MFQHIPVIVCVHRVPMSSCLRCEYSTLLSTCAHHDSESNRSSSPVEVEQVCNLLARLRGAAVLTETAGRQVSRARGHAANKSSWSISAALRVHRGAHVFRCCQACLVPIGSTQPRHRLQPLQSMHIQAAQGPPCVCAAAIACTCLGQQECVAQGQLGIRATLMARPSAVDAPGRHRVHGVLV